VCEAIRRDADNLGALLRWARARIDADPVLAAAPVEVQVAVFRAVLPGNLIGVTHCSTSAGT
jgi:hypothetical protein